MFCPGKWLMCEQYQHEEVTPGGVIIPEKARAKHAPARGIVIEAGVECKFVKKDDEILFSKENAFTDTLPGEDGEKKTYVFFQEDDVCVVTNRN